MLKSLIKNTLRSFGFDIVKYSNRNQTKSTENNFPADFDNQDIQLINEVSSYTMTSKERIHTLINAVKYITTEKISGDIVECGVWKGGSMMAVAKTLLKLGDQSRNLYLFDTFSGMSEPTEKDIDFNGNNAEKILKNSNKEDDRSFWCNATLDEVKSVIYSTGYNPEKIHFIKGKVEDTLPEQAPTQIALLRLDTDWYESTHHELIHLFPILNQHGILIIDDYGYWQGAKLAVDEYFQQQQIRIFLSRIDDTGRVAIKL
ncbi:MAG: macrocin O-methyltransferase [Pseudanabaena frigida]|uniref:Macrocin O-methyltransferase n=1 Tax=Pseudanabaena frigida TaxID=945775 RepID=A0A2W4W0J4_9CYAN|nr:MAG: macrocin O-methyltransferase [Pseudanabaena frigida]